MPVWAEVVLGGKTEQDRRTLMHLGLSGTESNEHFNSFQESDVTPCKNDACLWSNPSVQSVAHGCTAPYRHFPGPV